MASYIDIGLDLEKQYYLASSNNYEEHDPVYMYHVSSKPLHYDPVYKHHVSSHEKDDFITMSPKLIVSSECEVEHVRRICVAPTVEQCIIAIAPQDIPETFFVYRTKRVVSKSVIPYGVLDAPLTQERWLTRTRVFKLVAEIHTGDNCWSSKTEILSRKPEDGTPVNHIKIDFNNRGNVFSFKTQHKELNKTRSFLRKHEHNMFMNDIERKIHDNQRKMKLVLNRKINALRVK